MKKRKKDKEKTKRISFLTKRKNINDKFFDLVSEYIKPKKRGNKWLQTGITKLAKELEISPRTLRKYKNEGRINEKKEVLFINIERNFDKLKKIPRTKKFTHEYTPHNFTPRNFFPKKKFKRANKNEQFHFRAGLYLYFETIRKGKIRMKYAIQNLPISHYSDNYNRGYKEFFEIIKIKVSEHNSLKYFRFNYFDVSKIDIS